MGRPRKYITIEQRRHANKLQDRYMKGYKTAKNVESDLAYLDLLNMIQGMEVIEGITYLIGIKSDYELKLEEKRGYENGRIRTKIDAINDIVTQARENPPQVIIEKLVEIRKESIKKSEEGLK